MKVHNGNSNLTLKTNTEKFAFYLLQYIAGDSAADKLKGADCRQYISVFFLFICR